MGIPDTDELARRFFESADVRARQLGIRFDPAASTALRGMAREAATRVIEAAQKKAPEAAEVYAWTATRVGVEAMDTFVDQMAVARAKISGYLDSHGDAIGEQTFQWARERLCPLWPIC